MSDFDSTGVYRPLSEWCLYEVNLIAVGGANLTSHKDPLGLEYVSLQLAAFEKCSFSN